MPLIVLSETHAPRFNSSPHPLHGVIVDIVSSPTPAPIAAPHSTPRTAPRVRLFPRLISMDVIFAMGTATGADDGLPSVMVSAVRARTVVVCRPAKMPGDS